jgi:hypothetical protein
MQECFEAVGHASIFFSKHIHNSKHLHIFFFCRHPSTINTMQECFETVGRESIFFFWKHTQFFPTQIQSGKKHDGRVLRDTQLYIIFSHIHNCFPRTQLYIIVAHIHNWCIILSHIHNCFPQIQTGNKHDGRVVRGLWSRRAHPRNLQIFRVRVCILHPTPYTLHPTPYTLHPTCIWHPTPYTLPASCTLHPTPYTLPVSYTLHPTCIWHPTKIPASYIWHPTPYTLHPTPYTLHPTPYLHLTPYKNTCILHLTPYTYTLHPTPYTLHPTPYTLHPTPYTRRRIVTQDTSSRRIQTKQPSTKLT